jgi:hypothetical protein
MLRDASFDRIMKTARVDTSSLMAESVARQKIKGESLMMTCTRCGRQDTVLEAETGLCLVCVGKELEAS